MERKSGVSAEKETREDGAKEAGLRKRFDGLGFFSWAPNHIKAKENYLQIPDKFQKYLYILIYFIFKL